MVCYSYCSKYSVTSIEMFLYTPKTYKSHVYLHVLIEVRSYSDTGLQINICFKN